MTPITSVEAFLVVAIPCVLVVIAYYIGFMSGRGGRR